jgi:hypothetical protein
MELQKLIEKYGSDKNASGYTYAYEDYFSNIRESVGSLLEIGLGTIIPGAKSSMHDWKTTNISEYKPGASLRAWQDYFPNARIYGGDIQKDTQFTDDRIQTYLFNSQSGVECNRALKDLTFDIIIDDGDHDAASQIKTAYNLMHRVNPNGFYIIEDITPGNYELVLNYLAPIVQILNCDTFLLEPEKNLLIIKYK